ncbi:hypothetical protein CORC01_07197 [Colletotrichum orchidophilum]|uniref:Wax synthase domain-containing protein n=1 Tax=Colletotrichum orchidophilum TaxID=1209926 RepID=A0A1G4B8I5_9PEZI|nr:uncharacterized protein CORC01_07197 [Colletotrichum orchidophilum]OHE97582.1 hypothetical protein CORC01_07197 [Colletotrichum orchidophilum]
MMGAKSHWYLAIFLGSSTLTLASVYNSKLISHATSSFLVHATTSILLYFTSLTSLSFVAAEDWRLNARLKRAHGGGIEPFRFWAKEHAIFVTRATGLVAGAYLMALPLLVPTDDPIANLFLRIPTFFYACKCWDLTVARARKPPIPRSGKEDAIYGLTSWRPVASYVWRLASETRYASFDIAVDESKRKSIPTSPARTYGPLLVVPLTYLFPIMELKVMCGLLAIQYGLEGFHSILHPRCPNALFFQPWTAESFTSFWAIHWHHGAQPFLQSLGYVPATAVFARLLGQDAGRAAGVLAAFSLSGIWHGWCAAVMAKDEYAWALSVGVWGVFMVQGVGCVVDRWLLRNESWRTGWRKRIVTALSWLCSVESAAICLRYSEARAKRPQGWTTW